MTLTLDCGPIKETLDERDGRPLLRYRCACNSVWGEIWVSDTRRPDDSVWFQCQRENVVKSMRVYHGAVDDAASRNEVSPAVL